MDILELKADEVWKDQERRWYADNQAAIAATVGWFIAAPDPCWACQSRVWEVHAVSGGVCCVRCAACRATRETTPAHLIVQGAYGRRRSLADAISDATRTLARMRTGRWCTRQPSWGAFHPAASHGEAFCRPQVGVDAVNAALEDLLSRA